MKSFSLICFVFCWGNKTLAQSFPIQPGFSSQSPLGWNFYQETPPQDPQKPEPGGKPEKKVEQKQVPPLPLEVSPKPLTDAEHLEAQRQDLEQRLATAIRKPTLENVQTYRKLQDKILMDATHFQEVFMLAHLMEASSFGKQDQMNPLHRKIWEEEEAQVLTQNLKKLAKSYGLFFLISPTCHYCAQFTPLVSEFAATYGFSLMAISPQGGLIHGLTTLADNGMSAKLNPQDITPSLFLVDLSGRHAPFPLAWGLVSLSELKDNAKTILQALEAQP